MLKIKAKILAFICLLVTFMSNFSPCIGASDLEGKVNFNNRQMKIWENIRQAKFKVIICDRKCIQAEEDYMNYAPQNVKNSNITVEDYIMNLDKVKKNFKITLENFYKSNVSYWKKRGYICPLKENMAYPPIKVKLTQGFIDVLELVKENGITCEVKNMIGNIGHDLINLQKFNKRELDQFFETAFRSNVSLEDFKINLYVMFRRILQRINEINKI